MWYRCDIALRNPFSQNKSKIVYMYEVLGKIIWQYIQQGSPHIVKTGRLDFSLPWLTGEVRENLGEFRKLNQILTFLSPLPHVPLPFTKTNNDLNAINEFGIKYWTSNPVWVTFQEPFMWILKKKCNYWWKKYGLEKTDRVTKTWQKLGDFIETKAKKSPTLPGLVSPAYRTTAAI
jgi:hypothetical protein